MQSLGLKVFTDLGVGARSKGRRSRNNANGFLVFDLGTRKNWCYSSESGDHGSRFCKIVACSSPRNVDGESPTPTPNSVSGPGSGGLVCRTETYAMLKQRMEVAAEAEDYEEAARIRDSLRSFEEEEPVLRLRRLLKQAIAEERFEDAARYRDELKEIAPHSLLKCESDATTLVKS